MTKDSTKPPKSLVSKLALVCAAVRGIGKLGHNDYADYNWLKAADIAKAFRDELFKRKIILISDEKELTEVQVPSALPGVTLRQVTLKVEYTLHDGDSGQTLTATGFGVALGTDDKMLYKAKTGALKYFLRNLGIVPDELDDVEFDEGVDETTDPRLAEPVTDMSLRKRRTKIGSYKVRAFNAACHQYGKTTTQIGEYLNTKFNAPSPASLNNEQFEEAMKWACGAEPLAETIKTTLESLLVKKKANGALPPGESQTQAVNL